MRYTSKEKNLCDRSLKVFTMILLEKDVEYQETLSGLFEELSILLNVGQHIQIMSAEKLVTLSNQIKFYLVTHNTYYVHFITSVVTEEIL